MPFLLLNQQHQITEGTLIVTYHTIFKQTDINTIYLTSTEHNIKNSFTYLTTNVLTFLHATLQCLVIRDQATEGHLLYNE